MKNNREAARLGAYATTADFKRIFSEDVNSLYLLSLLLTGSPETAENCFVEGVGEAVKGNYVFKEWARSWTTYDHSERDSPNRAFALRSARWLEH